MKFGFSRRLAYTSVLAGLAAPAALAQANDNPFFRARYVAVTDRAQPQFDPLPLHLGAFFLNSSLGAGVAYDDNVYGAANNKVNDTYYQLQPQAELVSNWSQNALSLGFSVNDREYSKQDRESSTDVEGHIRGRLDVTRDLQLGGEVSQARLHEPRYDPGSPSAAAEPTEYTRSAFTGTALLRRDRFLIDAKAGSQKYDYDDVARLPGPITTPIDQDFRDFTENWFSARASYAMSPAVAFYVEGRYADDDYKQPGTVGNPSRDGKVMTGHVGVNFELAAPFRGDIGVGVVDDNKDSPLLTDSNTVSVNGNLQWFPTQLTTVTFSGARSVYDPGIQQSATAIYSRFGARIDHELRRNIVLFGNVTFSSNDYQGIDRTDDLVDAAAGLGYKMNRNVRMDLSYAFHRTNSSGLQADRDITENVITASLRFFP